MKTRGKKLIGILILFSCLLIDCDNDSKFDCTFVPCTDIFKMLVITIKHESDSSAYSLTNYKVIRVSDGKDFTLTNDLPLNQGYYPITNDTKKDIFINKNVELEFSGYLIDNLVIQKRFIVTADCCHISLIDGDSEFYI